MTRPKCDDDEFIALIQEHGVSGTARHLSVGCRSVQRRKVRLEKKLDVPVKAFQAFQSYPARLPLTVENGVVLVGSDAHLWPGNYTTAQRAFLKFAKELSPAAIILNGDNVDGARISRHPPLGFSDKPTVKQELDAVNSFLVDLNKAAPKSRHLWTLGNHDLRFEAKLAAQAGEFEGVQGFSLKDHFAAWTLAVSIWINGQVVVKHRYKGGIHATHNNTLWAGKTIVTGHLHSLKVTPFDDYDGTRFGVDTGTLADLTGPQFDYGEDNPTNHRAGFVVLTFVNGRLLWPEIVRVIDETHVEFRGSIIEV